MTDSLNRGDGRAADTTSQPLPNKRRPWTRRLLNAAGIALVIGALLVLALPTVLTSNFVVGLGLGQANKMFPGTVTIANVDLGWTQPLAIDDVTMNDANGEQFLKLEEFAMGRSIIGAATEPDRLGTLRLKALSVAVTKRADGTFNFADFIPPADPNAPPAVVEPTEPFELVLSKLLPTIPLPTSKLRLEIEAIDVVYTDESVPGSQPMRLAVDSALLDYPGGNAPLILTGKGVVAGFGSNVPYAFALKLSQWCDGTTIDFSRSTLDLVLSTDEKLDPATALLHAAAQIDGEKAVLRLSLPLDSLTPFRSVAPSLPELGGVVVLVASLDSRQNPAEVGVGIRLDQVRGSDGSKWRLATSNIDLYTTASIDRKALTPTGAIAELNSDFMKLGVDVSATSADSYAIHTQGSFESVPLLKLVDGDMLAAVPPTDVGVRLDVAGSVSTTGALDLESKFSLLPRSINVERLPFPEALRPTDPTLSLKVFSIDTDTHVARTAAGALTVTSKWKGPLGTLSAQVEQQQPILQTRLAVDSDLSVLDQWLRDSFVLQPAVGFGGQLGFTHELQMDSTRAHQKGRLSVAALSVTNDLIPNGQYTDDITLDWGAETAMNSGDHETDARIRLQSVYADLDTTVSAATTGLLAAEWNAALHLEPVINDLASPYLPPEPPMVFAGDVLLDGRVRAAKGGSWDIHTRVAAAENFALQLPSMVIAITKWDLGFGTHLGMNEGVYTLESVESTLGFQDFVRANLTGNVRTDTANHRFDLKSDTAIDWAGATAFLENYLASGFNVLFAAEGSSKLDLVVSGDMNTSGVITMSSPLRVEMSEHSTLDSMTVIAADQEFSLTGLEDKRAFRMTLPSLDPMQGEYAFGGSTTLAGLGWSGGATVEEMLLQDETNWTPAQGLVLAVDKAGIARTVYTSPAMILAIPSVNTSVHAKIPPSLLGADVDGKVTLGDDISGSMQLQWQRRISPSGTENDSLKLSSSLSLPLGSMASMESGKLVESMMSKLEGLFTTSLQANLIREGQPGDWSLPSIKAYDGNLTMELTGLNLEMPSAVMADGSMSINLYTFDDSWYLDAQARPQLVSAAGMALPYLDAMTGTLQARFVNMQDLSIDNAILEIPGGGTGLELRGEMREVTALSRSTKTGVDLLLDTPFQIFYTVRQDFSKVSAYGPAITGSGSMQLDGVFENFPGEQATFDSSLTMSEASIAYADMAKLSNLDGALPYTKRLFVDSTVTDHRRPVQGQMAMGSTAYQYPPYTLTIRNMAITGRLSNTSLVTQVRSSDFFGGTFDSQLSLRREQGDPVLEGVFSITGFDGASFLPALRRVSLNRRGFDAFGFGRTRLREGATIDGLLDDMVVRVDLTSFGREFLRESLRVVDPQGANPGIQSLNAMLVASSPVRGFIDLRGALLSCAVRMSTPTGTSVDVPIFDRTSISNLLEPYFDPSYDQMLVLGRSALNMLLAESFQEIRANLATGVQQ
ncbi:hypothetical protein GC173_11750 [bacterium]|nr:hypothetical protein [bacterium]